MILMYSLIWYGMVWYGMAWHGMVWYGIVVCRWYSIVQEGLFSALRSHATEVTPSVIHVHPRKYIACE